MQENGKQVTVKMTARRAYRTEPIWQYDVGHELVFVGFDGLPETFQVHFARNMFDEAVTMIGQDGVCAVPDMYAQTASPIYAWLYIAEDDTGLTKYSIEIPVERRAQITDQEPTPVEQSAIDQAIAALNEGVTRAEAAQAAAEGAQAGAEGYAETAADSAITATDAARAASASETAAAGSASAAASSATDARASREGADQSATAAGVSERAAKASETAAAGSASAAAGSASAAAGSASQAAGYASTATDNARAAAGSATAADTSARAAAGFAADSQQSAQAAAAIAQGAAASAAAADGSATEAAGSATAAAGSASAAAGSATAAAGSAQEAAQTVAGIDAAGAAQVAAIEAKGAEVIAEIPADYSELSGDVNSLKSAITELEPRVDSLEINKADIIVSSASGSIASFSDGADGMPVKELSVAIEPVQDLHGQDAPYPAGGGKNLCPPIVLPLASGTVLREFPSEITLSALSLSLKFSGSFANVGAAFLIGKDAEGTNTFVITPGYLKKVSDGTSLVANTTYTNEPVVFSLSSLSASGKLKRIEFYNYPSFTNGVFDALMLEDSATVTAYAPYSNICPITGWDAVKVTRTGKNLCDESKLLLANGWTENNGEYSGVNSALHFAFSNGFPGINFKANTICTVSFKFRASTASKLTVVGFKYTDGTQSAIYIQGTDDHTVSHTSTAGKSVSYLFFSYGSSDTVYIRQMQVEEGSTATDYEPYSGQTYSITLPSEAGTVYGGELTVNEDGTGTLVVDRAFKAFTQVNGKTESENGYFWYTTSTSLNIPVIKGLNEKLICNRLYPEPNLSQNSYEGRITFYANGIIRWKEQGLFTLEEYRAYLTNNPLEICYELATPQTYTLTASQVTTLLGPNRIWSDAGAVSVDYCADTKTYVDNAAEDVPVKDVQINGESILQDGVANVPIATSSVLGAVKVYHANGLIMQNGSVIINAASPTMAKLGTDTTHPIVPARQGDSAFYGLAKAAGDSTQSASSNAVGNYTDEAKQKIQKMIGTPGSYRVVADVTLADDVPYNNAYVIDLSDYPAKEIFLFVDVKEAIATTSIRFEIFNSDNLVMYGESFTAGISTSEKIRLFNFEIAGDYAITSTKEGNSLGGALGQSLVKLWSGRKHDGIYRVVVRPYNDAADIPVGSIIRLFAK